MPMSSCICLYDKKQDKMKFQFQFFIFFFFVMMFCTHKNNKNITCFINYFYKINLWYLVRFSKIVAQFFLICSTNIKSILATGRKHSNTAEITLPHYDTHLPHALNASNCAMEL